MTKLIKRERPWMAAGLLAGSLVLSGCNIEEDSNDSSRKNNSSSKSPETGFLISSDSNVLEGDSKHTYTHVVNLSVKQDKPVKFSYETRDGTAISGEDYEQQSGSVTLPPGASQATIEIPILGDLAREPDEQFQIHLSSVKNAKLKDGKSKAIINIANDDEKPTLNFEKSQVSVDESVGTIKVKAILSQESGYPVEVDLDKKGTAKEDDDYTINDPLKLTFSPGETQASIDVNILQDDIDEGGETIKFTFGAIEEAQLPVSGGAEEHTIIIRGNNVLNDTGVTSFSDGSTLAPSEPATHPGQDASVGLDASTDIDDYNGHQGFKFEKFDQDGNALPLNASRWACVQDLRTGLVWENKTADVSIEGTEDEDTGKKTYPLLTKHEFQAGNFVYGWRDDNDETNGGDKGYLETGGVAPPTANPVATTGECGYDINPQRAHPLFCHTKSYVQELNEKNVCGFKNWRMPTIEELRSIANHEPTVGAGSLPESDFFHNLKGKDGAEISRYFSSTPSSDNEGSAWCYDFSEGKARLCNKDTYRSVIAVRNQQ